MRFSAGTAANAAAWVVFFALAAAALALALRLGFLGLVLVGGATSLVCVMAELDRNAPTWGTEVFRAQMARTVSAEQRAALAEEDRTLLSPLRFYRRCGLLLVAVGGVGFAVQYM